MQVCKNASSAPIKEKGFTLMELLIVVAIIVVLIAIAIPVFNTQLEKSRNATDAYNAKTIAHSVQTYLMLNPDAMSEFINTYGANPGAYRPYILVTDTVLAISSDSTGILKAALSETNLLGKEIRQERFDGVLCKTKNSWQSYTIGFTVIDGELQVGYCGMMNKTMNSKRWTFWSEPDPTPFRSLCTAETS